MDIENLAKELILKNMNPEQQLAVLEGIKASVAQAKEVQKQRIGENVGLVVDALKKIESDIRSRFDEVGTAIEHRVNAIKDGRDGINGQDGKNGKDGRDGKQGVQGVKGKDGRDGRDGVDGVDGVSVTSAHIDFDGSLVIGLSSGVELNVGEVLAPSLAESIKVITNGGGTSQSVIDTLASLQTQITNLIPSQTGNSGKYLTTNGTALSWGSITGTLSYQGTWNASTNTPTLVSSTGTKNYYYVVATAGSTNLNGITDWQIGDWLLFNGTVWQKIDTTDQVTSVNGQTGAVSVGTVTSVSALTLGTTGTDLSSTVANSTSTPVITLNVPTASATNRGVLSSADWTTFNNKGSGTVTSVTGTSPVASSGGATPAISLSAGYGDTLNPYASKTAKYVLAAPNAADGAPTFRAIVASDIPTLNQSTTGSAATLTTARAIYGNNFDGSAALTQIIASTYGGTGNGFTKFTGATTAERTYTLPDATTTILTTNAAVTVGQGGTGQTTANAGFNALAPSQATNSGKYLTTNGTDTSWATVTGGSGTVTSVGQTFTGGLISVSGSPITTTGTLALTVAGTSGGIPYFSSASTWATSAALAANALVIGGGAGAAPATTTTGTGVVTALGVNTGTSGAFVVNGGVLGTPSSGTLTNCTFPTLNQNTTGSAATVTGNATGSTFGFNSGYGSVATAYGCRAWCNMNGLSGASPVIRGSGNITSVTRNSTGAYTVSLATTMPNANYSVVGACSGDTVNSFHRSFEPFFNGSGVQTPTTSSFIFSTYVGNGAIIDSEYVCFSVFR